MSRRLNQYLTEKYAKHASEKKLPSQVLPDTSRSLEIEPSAQVSTIPAVNDTSSDGDTTLVDSVENAYECLPKGSLLRELFSPTFPSRPLPVSCTETHSTVASSESCEVPGFDNLSARVTEQMDCSPIQSEYNLDVF